MKAIDPTISILYVNAELFQPDGSPGPLIYETYGIAALACACLALGILLLAIFSRRRTPAVHCPGPGLRWIAWLNPLNWYFRRGCWYDLSGSIPDVQGVIRCPECGTRSLPRERLRNGRRWRPVVVGATFLLLSCGGTITSAIGSGRWIQGVPNLLLIAGEWAVPHQRARLIRVEVCRRAEKREFADISVALLLPKLIADLRADDRHGNAARAQELLTQFWPESRPALEAALSDRDLQCRLAAAQLLRQSCGHDASDALLRACVEDLRDDGDAGDVYTTSNAREAAEYLSQFPDRAEPFLRPALQSNDAQQRLLAAAVAGHCHLVHLVDLAAPILIDHLLDNGRDGDAKIAAPALFQFGPDVVPYLEPHLESDDPQLRVVVRTIVARFQSSLPPTPTTKPFITETTSDFLSLSLRDGFESLGAFSDARRSDLRE